MIIRLIVMTVLLATFAGQAVASNCKVFAPTPDGPNKNLNNPDRADFVSAKVELDNVFECLSIVVTQQKNRDPVAAIVSLKIGGNLESGDDPVELHLGYVIEEDSVETKVCAVTQVRLKSSLNFNDSVHCLIPLRTNTKKPSKKTIITAKFEESATTKIKKATFEMSIVFRRLTNRSVVELIPTGRLNLNTGEDPRLIDMNDAVEHAKTLKLKKEKTKLFYAK